MNFNFTPKNNLDKLVSSCDDNLWDIAEVVSLTG